MERFVIGAAIVAAVAIAAAATFGGAITSSDAFRFSISQDEGDVTGGGMAASTSPKAYTVTKLDIDDAVAVVTVIPEDRADLEITVSNPGALKMPTVRVQGDRLVVDGGLRGDIKSCSERNDEFFVRVSGVGEVRQSQMPVVTVRTPRNVDYSADGAVMATIGDAQNVRIRNAGCGDASIGAVAETLDIADSGSGSMRTGSARSATLALSGSGDFDVGAVAERLSVSLAGAGDVEVASVGGPLDISIAGSGSTTILGGRTTDASVSIAGSGDVEINGDVGELEANIAGSGNVTVTGAASSVNASIMGSGNVEVGAATGPVRRSVLGSGEVRIGH